MAGMGRKLPLADRPQTARFCLHLPVTSAFGNVLMGRNPTFGCWNDMNCMQPKPLIAGAMLTLCACASNVAPPAAAGPPFQPIAFFEGRSHGDGELRKLFSSP